MSAVSNSNNNRQKDGECLDGEGVILGGVKGGVKGGVSKKETFGLRH